MAEISFTRTVRPLLVAPAASVVVQFVFMAIFQRLPPLVLPFAMIVTWTWAFSLAAAILFVVPVLALVPRLRRPPLWVAAVWGAMAAWAFTALLVPGMRVMTTSSWTAWGGFAVAGAASGLFYALLVRRAPTAG